MYFECILEITSVLMKYPSNAWSLTIASFTSQHRIRSMRKKPLVAFNSSENTQSYQVFQDGKAWKDANNEFEDSKCKCLVILQWLDFGLCIYLPGVTKSKTLIRTIFQLQPLPSNQLKEHKPKQPTTPSLTHQFACEQFGLQVILCQFVFYLSFQRKYCFFCLLKSHPTSAQHILSNYMNQSLCKQLEEHS